MKRSIGSTNITTAGLAAALAAGCLCAQTPDGFRLLKTCSAGAETVATLQASDAVKVRFNYAGDAGNCYAVTATIGNRTVDGYLVGGSHPAIAAFEKEVRAQPLKIPPAAVASAAPAVKAVSVTAPAAGASPAVISPAPSAIPQAPLALPLSFAGFRAPSVNGGRVDLSAQRAPNVVIYFWSARTRGGAKTAERMDWVYDEFHKRGVDVVGVVSAASISQVIQVCKNNEIVWPQVMDSGAIASRYHVNPATPYLVLDQSRKVVAAVASPQALGPVLDQLTRYRRTSR